MNVLVTGGAGYVGSVCAAVLRRAGHGVVVLDDLSAGHRAAVDGPLVVADVRARAAVREVLRANAVDVVLHFAAKALVAESVAHPLAYFDTNVAGTLALVDAMLDGGVRSLVVSSTCAVYGQPERVPVDEDAALAPVSPYGESKAMMERALAACREREGLRVSFLRYFNAAGAFLDAGLGESHPVETHLIPLAIDAALGARPPVPLYGEDWETPDGTCVRDYVDVRDLASAHVTAAQRLVDGDRGSAYNLGTGRGTSVREILVAVERATGRAVPLLAAPRRPGDPASLYASAARARAELGWETRFSDLHAMVGSAVGWARNPRF